MSQQTKTHSHLVEIHTGSEVITYPLGKRKGERGFTPDLLADRRVTSSATKVKLKKYRLLCLYFFDYFIHLLCYL